MTSCFGCLTNTVVSRTVCVRADVGVSSLRSPLSHRRWFSIMSEIEMTGCWMSCLKCLSRTKENTLPVHTTALRSTFSFRNQTFGLSQQGSTILLEYQPMKLRMADGDLGVFMWLCMNQAILTRLGPGFNLDSTTDRVFSLVPSLNWCPGHLSASSLVQSQSCRRNYCGIYRHVDNLGHLYEYLFIKIKSTNSELRFFSDFL